jgi:hypothetical protein
MGDLGTAIADANGRVPNRALSGELGGMTLAPGVYKSDGIFSITGTLYLDGQNDPNAAWIFIMATNLAVNPGGAVVMQNYDNTRGTNVWWSCGNRADIFTTAKLQGTVMAYQSIAAQNGATTGPLMANIGEVTLLANVVNSYSHFTNATVPVQYTPLLESSADSSSSLSSGAIAGIVIGVVLVLLLLAVVIYCIAYCATTVGYSAPPKDTTVSLPV